MKTHLVWLVLAVSVLFNVFFAVGFMKARDEARRADVPRRVADALKLDEKQAAVFASLRSGVQDEIAVYDDTIALAQQELVEELGREQPDLERVGAIVARKVDLDQARRLAGARRFNEFVGVLSPQQCRELSREFRQGPRGRRRFEMIKRFDADGDGTLDAQERQAAREFIEARRGEREKRRQELMERFDENQDGNLDPDERAAARDWMKQKKHRGSGG